MPFSHVCLARLAVLLGFLLAVTDVHAEAVAPGSTCTLSGPLVLSPTAGAPPGTALAKGGSVTIVEVAKAWVSVKSGDTTGQAKLKDLRKVCKNIKPPVHEAGSTCHLNKPTKLGEKPNGKGKKTAAKAGADLTVAEATPKAYKVTLGDASGYVALAVLNKICTWQEKPIAKAEPAPAAPAPAPAADTTPAAPTAPPPPSPDGQAEAAASPSATPALGAPVTTPDASNPPPDTATPAPAPAAPKVVAKGDAAGKTKIAVMDLRHADNIDKNLMQSLGALIPQVLDEIGPFKAISSQDIAQMLAMDSMKQQVGCDNVSCLAEIGGALGADYMVSGSMLLAGETYLIQLQLMNINKSRVDGRASREYKGGPAGLFDEMRTATKLLVRDILAAQSGKLLLAVSEQGATVRIDGTIVGTSPLLAQSVPGGMHTVTVDKEGFVRASLDVEIKANEETKAQAQMRPSEEFVAQFRSRAGTMRALAWTSIGIAVVGLGAGGALHAVTGSKATSAANQIRAYNQNPAPTPADYNKALQAKKNVATLDALTLTSGGIGLVAAVAGALMYTLGDNPHRYDNLGGSAVASSQPDTPHPLSFSISPFGVGLAVGF